MSRIAYVNGRYLPQQAAAVHVEDRGYQFSDGVYEVCEVRGGSIIDQRRHLVRLKRSLDELRIDMPMSEAALATVMRECVRRNRVRDGIIYLQITRGVARRDHAFPPAGTRPSIVITAHGLDVVANESTSSQSRCCPMCWRNKRRASAEPKRRGSSTVTEISPRGRRATRGSSQRAARW
jgi:D-alanine transaminase